MEALLAEMCEGYDSCEPMTDRRSRSDRPQSDRRDRPEIEPTPPGGRRDSSSISTPNFSAKNGVKLGNSAVAVFGRVCVRAFGKYCGGSERGCWRRPIGPSAVHLVIETSEVFLTGSSFDEAFGLARDPEGVGGNTISRTMNRDIQATRC